MAQSVYKLWQGRFTEAWQQLPQKEQQRLLSLVMEALSQAGGKELVICSCRLVQRAMALLRCRGIPRPGSRAASRTVSDRPQLGPAI
jgi:hypothetical protein